VATAPVRPPWFGNRAVQLLGALVAVYSLVQVVLHLVDGEYGSAFLSFAYGVVFGYIGVESWRFRQQQVAAAARDTDGPPPPA
jgi:hypothetical protein